MNRGRSFILIFAAQVAAMNLLAACGTDPGNGATQADSSSSVVSTVSPVETGSDAPSVSVSESKPEPESSAGSDSRQSDDASDAASTTQPQKQSTYIPEYRETDGYDDADDFADDWAEEYADEYDDYEDALDDAYDVWEEEHDD